MKKQQKYLIEIDDDLIRSLCDKLPLEETDRKLAYALATLCAQLGSYTPARGVGQKEIAKLAGLGVRTVKRRLLYLERYGILWIDRTNGRSSVYHFDMSMLLDAPAATHNLYGYIKAKPAKSEKPEAKQSETNDRQRLLFDDQDEVDSTAPAGVDKFSWLSRLTGAVGQFAKRMFTGSADDLPAETGANAPEPGPSSQKPGPTSHDQAVNRGQTGAIVSEVASEPGPTAEFGAENDTEPGPNRGQLPLNRGQTGAKPGPTLPTLHIHDTSTAEETLIKNYSLHEHVHVDSDFDSSESRGAPPGGFRLPPRTSQPRIRNEDLPPGERKIIWGRDVREDDLRNPAALQELFEIAIEQGFCLDSEKWRENFFALAHYVCRQPKAANKVGLFSSYLDRTIRDKFGKPFEDKLSDKDDKWAAKAIHDYDFPPLTTGTERMNQP